MCWIVRSSEIRLVAAVTRSRQCRVVVIRVAGCARNGRMCPGQRERRSVVIESRPCPICRRVASCTRSGETCSGVRRGIGPGVIRFVARIAVGWHRCVVVIGVALHAC